ncbi:hypothetical protein [Streptomyces sp. PR69]|uniref:hypothetical protein n=1 Tax=Streptomyces sp. PR69 TaxID=2984950 RepID=UPI0022651E56|nr:hypothetical protein [Streptomyces sp. PR69]
MVWDEWEQIKAEAAAGHDRDLQGSGAGGTPGTADLKTSAQGKRGAIKALVEVIRPGLDKAGVHADETTDDAEREFQGWATGAGLKDAHDEWALQVSGLKARLAQEQELLGRTKRDFQLFEHGVESSLMRIARGPDPRRDA